MDTPPIEYATTSDGVRIAYARYPGDSPVFLRVNTPGAPPLAMRLRMVGYDGWFRRFLRGRAGVSFDWRGSGDSDSVTPPIAIDDLVADLEAVTTAIGEPVDAQFLGAAWLTGALHAARHPARYRSIWVVGGSVRPGESWQGYRARPGWEQNYSDHLQGLLRGYSNVSITTARRIAALVEQGVPQEVFGAYRDAEAGIDLSDVLPQIDIPVWAASSQPMDYEPASVLAAFLPDATVSALELPKQELESGSYERDEWDRHLGARLGDPSSTPVATDITTEGPRNPGGLSVREIEVLQLVAAGDANKQIAVSLDIAAGTVARHVSNILKKTGLENRRQLMRYADEHYPEA